MPFGLILLVLLLLFGSAVTIYYKKLTPLAALAGSVIALIIFLGTGYLGFIIMLCFFLLAVVATAMGGHRKGKEFKEIRNASQVVANAGLGGLLGACALFDTEFAFQYTILLAAAFASSASDTLSSEIGNAYGTKYTDIKTLRNGLKGENGVISIEGSIAGVIGALIIGWVYSAYYDNYSLLLLITAAGMLGNLADTLMGAWLERSNLISNNFVNFLNTLAAAVFMAVIA